MILSELTKISSYRLHYAHSKHTGELQKGHEVVISYSGIECDVSIFIARCHGNGPIYMDL